LRYARISAERAVGSKRMHHTSRHRLRAQPTEGNDAACREGRAGKCGGKLGQGQPMPAKSGPLHLSDPARHVTGRVEVRPDDQYFFRRLARALARPRCRPSWMTFLDAMPMTKERMIAALTATNTKT